MFYFGPGGTTPQKVSLTYGGMYKAFEDAYATNTKGLMDSLMKIDELAISVTKNFGLGRENIRDMKSAIGDAKEGLAQLNMTMEDGYKMLLESGQKVGRNIILSTEGQLDLAAAMKVTSKSAADIVGPLKDVGISANQAGKEMEKIVNSARQIGVNSSATVDMVLKNTAALNQYNFQGGVEGLAKMAAQAVSLRIDMSSTLKVAEDLLNPEKAIQMAASLQRLGVTQTELLDPLSLMNLAENDPAELQNQIAEMSKSFVRLNQDGKFEIMPGAKRRMREIEKSLGMQSGTLSKMALAGAELDDKMKKINFGGTFTEEQKKLIANMSEMGEGGEYRMRIDGKDLNMDEAMTKIRGMSDAEREKFFEAQKPKSMEELAKGQLTQLETINTSVLSMSDRVAASVASTAFGENLIGSIGSGMKGAYETLGNKLVGTKEQIDSVIKNETFQREMITKLNNANSMTSDNLLQLTNKMIAYVGVATEFSVKMAEASFGNIGSGGNINKGVTSNEVGSATDLKKVINSVKDIGIQTYEGLKKIGKNFFPNDTSFNDGIITSSGFIKTAPQDTIVAATGLDVIADIIKNPVDPNKLVASMAAKVGSSSSSVIGPEKIQIDLNVNVTAPSQIDTAQITNVLKDQLVIQEIITKMRQVQSNNNLTPFRASV